MVSWTCLNATWDLGFATSKLEKLWIEKEMLEENLLKHITSSVTTGKIEVRYRKIWVWVDVDIVDFRIQEF